MFALAATLAEIVVGAVALAQFSTGQGMQFVTDRVWISDFVLGTPVRYHVGMDGLGLFMMLLTAVGIAASVGAGIRAGRDRPRAYYGLVLLLEAALVLLFTAQDLVLFYVGWEVMMIPLFILMAVWGGEGRRAATIRFVIYTMVGSLLMLVAIAAIGIRYHTFEVSQVHSGAAWIFFFFAAAFCIKAPLFPLHGWMPAAYRESAPETTALLSGVISKAGAYGLLRFCLPMFPGPAHDWRWLFLGLALVGAAVRLTAGLPAGRRPGCGGLLLAGTDEPDRDRDLRPQRQRLDRRHLPDGQSRPGVAGSVPGDRPDRAARREGRLPLAGRPGQRPPAVLDGAC